MFGFLVEVFISGIEFGSALIFLCGNAAPRFFVVFLLELLVGLWRV